MTTNAIQKRQPKGTENGGKLAPDVNPESTAVLDDRPVAYLADEHSRTQRLKQKTQSSAETTKVQVETSGDKKSNRVSAMISLAEAAEFLGIHRATAWSINNRGEFPVPVFKVGGSLRVVRAHLQQFIDTGEKVSLPNRVDADSTSLAR